MRKAAIDLLRWCWGGMITDGADTFWEVYDPGNAWRLPYDSHHVKSYRHAWSCTPAYLLRKLNPGR